MVLRASPLVAEAGAVKLNEGRALSVQNLSEDYLMKFAGSVTIGRSGCVAHTARANHEYRNKPLGDTPKVALSQAGFVESG